MLSEVRTHFQVLVIPYFIKEGKISYALFKREDLKVWQGVAGGGEDEETPLEAAKREAFEEAGINETAKFTQLASMTTMPVTNLRHGMKYGKDVVALPEFAFGVQLDNQKISITNEEHLEFGWFGYEEAIEKLNWESNKNALWELNYRLTEGDLGGVNSNREVIKSLMNR